METPVSEEFQKIDLFSINKIISLINYYNPCKKIDIEKLDNMMAS